MIKNKNNNNDKNNDNNDNEDEFADLLENSISENNSFEPGQLIETEIVNISSDCIFLYLGGKSEGQLEGESEEPGNPVLPRNRVA